MLGRIRTLIVKELLALLRDKKSRFVLIVPPLVQLFVFSFAATLEVNNQSLAILNQDRGRPAAVLAARFAAAGTFSAMLHLQRPEQIAPLIDRQQAIAVLWIPAGLLRQPRRRPPGAGELHRRRPQDQRGADRPGLRPAHRQPVPRRTRSRRGAAGGAAGGAQLVQPQPRFPLVHGAEPGLHPHHPDRRAGHRPVGGAGTGDGDLRPVAGLPPASAGDPRRQGAAGAAWWRWPRGAS